MLISKAVLLAAIIAQVVSKGTGITYPAEVPFSTPLINPERGLYTQYSYYASNPSRLSSSSLADLRNNSGQSIILRLYYLDTYVNTDNIAQSVLDDIVADFQAMREAGVKCILRFAYRDNDSQSPSDPAKSRLIGHIGQLAPSLQNNQDMIIVAQAGFVGPWGEWHSSFNFNDINDPDYDHRGDILMALEDAIPERIVQIRTPLHKRSIFSIDPVPPQPSGGFLLDGSFEVPGATNWGLFSGGFVHDSTRSNSGSHSVRITNGGASQFVSFNPHIEAGSIVKISGYSMAEGTSTGLSSDYSVYSDVTLVDSSNNQSFLWGEVATFTGGTSTSWEYAEHSFTIPSGKSMSAMSIYAMYRNDVAFGGTAYFDDLDILVYPPVELPSMLDQALNSSNAYDGSYKARTGHHNDCFLASENDLGTYIDDLGTEYPYLSQDTKYTAMGGETCALHSRSNCATAKEELDLFHYTYINSGYNLDVLGLWQTDGCWDEIVAKLGYRIVLTEGTFPSAAEQGGVVSYEITLVNNGYASPINKRRVQLVFRKTDSGSICASTDTSVDTRTWYGGGDNHILSGNAILPTDMAPGTYDLLLHITDTDESLRTKLEFKTAVANAGLNEVETGLIKLNHVITITSSVSLRQRRLQASDFAVVCGVEDDILPNLPAPATLVINGGFEEGSSTVADGWGHFGTSGYAISTSEFRSGTRSVAVTNGAAAQYVAFDPPVSSGSTIETSGCSKAVGTSTGLMHYYSIYQDVALSDGSYLWGENALFAGGTTGWECVTHSLTVPTGKSVVSLSLYAMYQNDPSPGGTAYFDDFEIVVVNA